MTKKTQPFPYNKNTSSKLVEAKIPADCLEIGMHVVRLDRPWTEVPVLLQEITIKSPDDIEMLRSHCDYVYIEVDEEFWLDAKIGSDKEKKESSYPGFREQKELHDELPNAKFTMEETQAHVDEVLESISNGESIDLDESRKAIQSCVKSIMSNANALLWLTQIRNQDSYTSEHSLRVGVLAIAFGRFIGIDGQDLELLGLCGILHDVGKMKIPGEILNKPARLSRVEFEIMKEHAFLGMQSLSEQPGVDKLIIDTAHYHHERLDGQGYPDQLHANYLHRFIRMISVVDVYDAITSTRHYKAGSPAFDALKILFSERGRHFDVELVEAFIRMVGLYPPGTLVEMTNGEVGIVVSANPGWRLRPRVELVMTSDKKFRPPYIVNLLDDARDKAGNVYAIKEGLGNGTYGIDVKDYILR